MSPLRPALSALGLISAMGSGKAATEAVLFDGAPAAVGPRGGFLPDRTAVLAAAPDPLPALPPGLEVHDSRNNRLLWAAATEILPEIATALAAHGPQRMGIVLGTSTSGIEEGTAAYHTWLETGALPPDYAYGRQEIGSPAAFLRDAVGARGPCHVISTACSSSAKALASATRLLKAGLCDAVLVGGVDSLCRLTVNGFHALELVSGSRCNPFSRNRDGITIGEGAALFLMTRSGGPVTLLGVGESADAHHPNAPHPEGLGAIRAMEDALARAGLGADAIAYLNLHGTATPLNDAMEAKAVARVLGGHVPVSSTKPLTGHTLGVAGALEAAVLWLSLRHAAEGCPLPRHLWDGAADPALPALALIDQPGQRLPPARTRAMMSTSFAFGGSNVAVILGSGPVTESAS